MNFDVTAGAQPSSIITIFWFHGEVAAPHSGIWLRCTFGYRIHTQRST